VIGFSRDRSQAILVRNHCDRFVRCQSAPQSRTVNALDDPLFFAELAEVLDRAGAISYITGDGPAKAEFRRYLDEQRPWAGARVVDLADLEHVSTRRLLTIGRAFFQRFDDQPRGRRRRRGR
jgi:hypothetical protein